jgi:hypothetical protein
LIDSFKISLPGTHKTISVVNQERDYSLMCPMPELVYSIQEPIAAPESQQGFHEPKSGRLHEGRPQAVNPQF